MKVDAAFGKEGYGLEIKPLGMDADTLETKAQLFPEEKRPYRLVDEEGQPIGGVNVRVTSIVKDNVNDWMELSFPDLKEPLPFWPAPIKTDQDGRLTVSGIAQEYKVGIKICDDRFAREVKFSKPEGNRKSNHGNGIALENFGRRCYLCRYPRTGGECASIRSIVRRTPR